MSANAYFRVPHITNEPNLHYGPGSAERAALALALGELEAEMPFDVPCVVNGKPVWSGDTAQQELPHDHARHLCTYQRATPEIVQTAITGALRAQHAWENMAWADRAAIFLRAADLLAGKYRYQVLAATMLGQGKNAWQAEIDVAAEGCDFLRFGVKYVDELYRQQPELHADGIWNRTEWRPLEGFVLAVTPFNFTAIGINLSCAPALLGNVCLWKPSPMATYSNYLVHKILLEAGLPPGVIQFVPGPPAEIVQQCIDHPDFAGLHYTGSTAVFQDVWSRIGRNIARYRSFPRIVGETGGKNFHLYHSSADVQSGVAQAIRCGFEYSGQKCSALSRIYVSRSLWEEGFEEALVSATERVSVGPCTVFENFLGPVINRAAYERILNAVGDAKAAGAKVLAGGTGDASRGFFVRPTVLLTQDPRSIAMTKEIFGPVITCYEWLGRETMTPQVYVYEDDEFEATCDLIDSTTDYALTGSVFASDRKALSVATDKLRRSAGNFYINDKCTGGVVGHQPFGGSRGSGTNDKAGSINLFYRFTSPRTIKENFRPVLDYRYPSNLA